MDYFYSPPESISDSTIEIRGEEFAHLVHVMRKKVGDQIRVVDGKGNAYEVILANVKKRVALGTIITRREHYHEPAVGVDVASGILKNPSKFDFLVEKVTELGVRRVIPLSTERTIPNHAKVERWQKLALAAMKQCGRSVLPQVEQLQTLSRILESVPSYDLAVVCHETPEVKMSMRLLVQRMKGKGSVLLLVGPEGGFSDKEIGACVEAGCLVATLGSRRLRTETAAMAAAALLLQE